MENFTVYCHTNKHNGKKYIGITGLSVLKRWGNDGSRYASCPYFYNAIKQHGWDSYTHEIICNGLTMQEAQQAEIRLIEEYKTTNPLYGYNLTQGGDCQIPNEATRKKMGDSRKGHKHSTETKIKMSVAAMGNTRCLGMKCSEKAKRMTRERSIGNTWNVGRKHTKEQTEKISKANKKEIVQLSLNGEFIKKYVSATDASDDTKVGRSCITACCRGRRKTAGGFIWRYASYAQWIPMGQQYFRN